MADKGCGGCAKSLDNSALHADVKEYYGVKVKTTADLQSNVCMTPATPLPAFIRKALGKVHSEVITKYYGCGLVVPESLEGCRILDLGSGSGRDVYMLSQLVGETGHVTGLDMTREQLDVAIKYVEHHMQEFGFKTPNVNFVEGYMEALGEAGLQNNSFDLVISNCVVNLSPDKKKVLTEAYNVLKDGGELYFSDVYSSARLPEDIKKHKVLWGECIGGALWWEDLVKLAEEVGFSRPRLVTASVITVDNKELLAVLGDFKFISATYRLFKGTTGCPRSCRVTYKGGITGVEKSFPFDCQYTFKAGEAVDVDVGLAKILSATRFSKHFTFETSSTPGSCGDKAKECVVDPFALVQQLEKQTPGSTTRGCCSSKSESCCK